MMATIQLIIIGLVVFLGGCIKQDPPWLPVPSQSIRVQIERSFVEVD